MVDETRVEEETTTARAMAELEARLEEKIEKQTVFILNTVTQALEIIGENSDEAQKTLDDTLAKLQQAVNELRKARGDDKGDIVDFPNPITPRRACSSSRNRFADPPPRSRPDRPRSAASNARAVMI